MPVTTPGLDHRRQLVVGPPRVTQRVGTPRHGALSGHPQAPGAEHRVHIPVVPPPCVQQAAVLSEPPLGLVTEGPGPGGVQPGHDRCRLGERRVRPACSGRNVGEHRDGIRPRIRPGQGWISQPQLRKHNPVRILSRPDDQLTKKRRRTGGQPVAKKVVPHLLDTPGQLGQFLEQSLPQGRLHPETRAGVVIDLGTEKVTLHQLVDELARVSGWRGIGGASDKDHHVSRDGVRHSEPGEPARQVGCRHYPPRKPAPYRQPGRPAASPGFIFGSASTTDYPRSRNPRQALIDVAGVVCTGGGRLDGGQQRHANSTLFCRARTLGRTHGGIAGGSCTFS